MRSLIIFCLMKPPPNMDPVSLLIQCIAIYGITSLSYMCLKWNFVKTTLDDIPGPPSQSFFSGNMGQYRGPTAIKFVHGLIHNYGQLVVKLHCLFNRPGLYIFDPKALHSILIKDEALWEEPPAFIATNLGLFGPGLLSTLGEQHRKQRRMLNPAFSVNHMRIMLPIFQETVERLRDALEARVSDMPQELDMAAWMGRTALEIIGQGGLGYSFDRLVSDNKDSLAISLKSLFPTIGRLEVLALVLPYARAVVPVRLRGILARIAPFSAARDMKLHADLVAQKLRQLFEVKKRAIEQGDEAIAQQIGGGKDLMSIFVKANAAASESESLDDDELSAQMATMVFAAMDTTSNSLARTLQCLADRPDVQQRLRAEIIEAFHGGELDYETLMNLPYLSAVCRETLRLHAPLFWSGRVAKSDAVVPLSRPIIGKSGKSMTELAVPAGTEVFIGIQGCNTSEFFWGEDAQEWKPERWLSPLPESITEAGMPGVAGILMTFLGGKRACIGFKFAELEMKVVLAILLQRFVFEPSDIEITWMPAPVLYPTTGSDRTHSHLPIRVRKYKAGK